MYDNYGNNHIYHRQTTFFYLIYLIELNVKKSYLAYFCMNLFLYKESDCLPGLEHILAVDFAPHVSIVLRVVPTSFEITK